MNESSGPRKARIRGECHVLVRIVWRREGIDGPQRRVLVPFESLKLMSQESATGPSVAQCSSAMVLLAKRSRKAGGRFRLKLINYCTKYSLNNSLLQALKGFGNEAIVCPKSKK